MTGILPFDFTQSTPATTWTITHNLGHRPAVSVTIDYNGGRQTVLPNSIEYTNSTTLTIKFTDAQSGSARLY